MKMKDDQLFDGTNWKAWKDDKGNKDDNGQSFANPIWEDRDDDDDVEEEDESTWS